MKKLLNDCLPSLNWKVAAVFGVVLVGIVFYAVQSSWGVWLSATPLLAIALCVLPCLIPLAFLWRKGGDQDSVQTK